MENREKNSDSNLSELRGKEHIESEENQKRLEPLDDIEVLKTNEEISPSLESGKEKLSDDMKVDKAIKQEVVEDLSDETNNSSNYLCRLCSFDCGSAAVLQSHLELHSEIKPQQCYLCPYNCYRKDFIDSHILLHDNENCYVCDVCCYRSTKKSLYDSHIKSHSEERTYRCYLCSFATARDNTLRIHMKKHTAREKLYQCPACPHKSATKFALKVHVQVHNKVEERPFVCPHCPYRSNQKVNLKKHIGSKHTAKPHFKCLFCPYKATEEACLKNHVATKHLVKKGERKKNIGQTKRRLDCHVCSFWCDSIPDLVNHLKVHIERSPPLLSPNFTIPLNFELI